MHKILDMYIKKSILSSISIVFLILISLSSIIRLIDGLRNFEKKTYSIIEIFFCTFLSLPKDFELFLPISILLGGLLGLGVLEIRNELVIMKVFGLSYFQITFSVVKVSVFILILHIMLNEWLLPGSQYMLYIYQGHKEYNSYFFPEKNKNLWIIDNNGFVCIEYMPTTNNVFGVNLYYLTKDKKIEKIIYFKDATYINKSWFVSSAIELNFSDKTHIVNRTVFHYKWNTILTPDLLSIITTNPRVLSVSKLFSCIKYFNGINQNSQYYELIFWNKILSPLTGMIMLIISLLYSFGPFSKKKIGFRLFFGSIIGFLFYVLHQFFDVFCVMHNIYPLVGSIIPVLLFIVINIVIVFYKISNFRFI
ncbi:putative permease [Candidatus Blochmanniella vafra str. BVAF]|uniref:Permease n=2 Tax=Candidatus Blochmanniella vafra TaxID=251535 RepID=E8Q6K9_BLOVB|nr:putative permease [Candidatus Blochmannia vafer str. BVAF]